MFTKLKKLFHTLNGYARLNIDRLPAEGITHLPTRLWPFIWFFLRQIKGLIAGIILIEGVFGILVSIMYWYVGALVDQGDYRGAMIWLGVALVAVRLFTGFVSEILYQLVYTPYVSNMVRHQLYWYTVRQPLSFFQNDFAGRLANKLQQTGPSLRDAVKSAISAIWFAAIFTVSNLYFLFRENIWLGLPLSVWLVCYIIVLIYFTPKVGERSRVHSEDFSTFMGQLVDSFTNALPIKYFARTQYEDQRALDHLRVHSESLRRATGTICLMSLVLEVMNVALIVSTALIGFKLIEMNGQAGVAATAMALPMALQATFQSNWIMYETSDVFDNLGNVQESVDTLTKPHRIVNIDQAPALQANANAAAVMFKNVCFDYDRAQDVMSKPVLQNFNLTIPAGQKVGVVGRSGAGKSTITSVLMRAYDIQQGEILIDGQNIAKVTQDSLRQNITMVTQESYLFHRSIFDNIQYGKPDATMDEVIAAAKKASAHEFILSLEDNEGRKGYEAYVGERGVKLSGGQKQRISIARAILKQAPVLILDEATSALDSESEHAIQFALEEIMENKTVIAVAHRLSTLRQMDRIIVIDAGKIVEDGTHEQLVKNQTSQYAKLWRMQSGGVLKEEKAASSFVFDDVDG